MCDSEPARVRPAHTSTVASGLCTENDWFLTSAFGNISLSLSDRYQKKKKKDTKLSFHGGRCDIRSFPPLVTLSLHDALPIFYLCDFGQDT